jgi:LPS-assembly protein
MWKKAGGFPGSRRIIGPALLLTLGLFLPAGAQTTVTPTPPQEEITVLARTQEKTKDRIFLSGDVEIRFKDLRLFADKVELDPKTKDCVATGNVTIQLPNESVSAEQVFINLETKRGKMVKADGMIQPTIFYKAGSVERKSADLYALDKPRITSCAQPVPRWEFSASRANLKKDDYVEMWNAVLHIKKVPIFYLPYMRFPVNQDRATGFLIPLIGFSAIKGFNYEQSFYWAIARNMDATFALDYYAARGLGGGLELRYLFNGGTGGTINLYGFSFKKDASGVKQDDAYILRIKHNQPLPMGINLVANVDLQSSYDFLREFDNNFQRAIVSNRNSQVYLQKSWSYFNISARASRFDTLFGQGLTNRSIISKSFPQINFSMFKVKLFSPVYISFSSSYSRQEYGWNTDYAKGTQRKTGNLSFNPSLSAPFTPFPWLTMNTSLTTNFVYYPRSFLAGTTIQSDNPIFTKNFTAAVGVVGPVFSRTYRDGKGDPIFKHIIEPYVNYNYDSPISLADRIITTYAFFYRYHTLQYGLTNRFFIPVNEMPREILQVGLAQTFYLDPEDGPLGRFLVNGKPPKFSELQGTMRYYPAGKFSLDVSAGYNPYYHLLSSLRVGANLGKRTDDIFLSVNWFKSSNVWYKDEISKVFGNRHQIGITSGFKIPKLPVEVLADIDFNIKEKKLLYLAASAVYHYQCLDFTFELRTFYYRAKPETQFKFSFGLGSIGKTTDFLGGFSSDPVEVRK